MTARKRRLEALGAGKCTGHLRRAHDSSSDGQNVAAGIRSPLELRPQLK
jgi:hypothetical protein